nr:His/Gly/Thr/Pro-type tRNA ligase C-terminal domain-containing protein [Saccharofermentans sp.]
VEGDACPKCGKPLSICRGVEVGHIFKLGTKYSKALNCNYLDRDGKENPMIMGCYGIGVGRTLAAVIEQNCDENGIKWPVAVAPYKAIVVPMKTNDDTIMGLANEIYETLLNDGVEVIIDDRNERPGVKFKDADLIGIPVRINVGRRAGEGIVEVNYRQSGEMVELDTLSAIEAVKNLK